MTAFRRLSFAAALVLAGTAAVPVVAQDVATGQIVFNQRCTFCHDLTRASARAADPNKLRNPEDLVPSESKMTQTKDEKVSPKADPGGKQGPHLTGLIGRQPGGLPHYPYVRDYTPYGTEWNAETLDAWIVKHDEGRTDAQARADIIAYLATLQSQ